MEKAAVTLGRNASTTIDVSKLIAAQQPDEDGNVIPFGTREGSVVFSSAQGMTQWWMTLAISIGILNAQAATCGGICANCCGYTGFGVTPSPGYCPLGLTAQCGAQATYCSGVVYSFTTSSSWSSSNTSVLTVNNTTQKGLVTGVAPGTATVTALFPSVIVFTGTICGDNTPTCPTSRPAPGGPVTALKVQVVTQDKIGLTLSPGNLSGNLRLELIGPGITHTIRYVTRSSGTYNETFDIPNLPEREFLTVRASWEVSGPQPSGH